ncbi:MAG: translocation/assembly module TamB domain-containing protein [Desulfuromonadales bacterium]
MRKLWRYLLFAIVLAVVFLAAGIGWFFWTPAGAQFLLAAVSRFSPLHIQAQSLSGRLADEVLLRDAVVRWPRGAATVDAARLRWHPAALLRGRIAVEELALTGVEARIAAAEPSAGEKEKAPPDFAFPEPGAFARWLQVAVEHLQADAIVLHPVAGEPLLGERLRAGVSWRQGVLRIDDLAFAGSPGRLDGAAAADFVAPALNLDFQAQPAAAVAGMEKISVRLQLQPAAGARRLAGPLQATVLADGRERLRLQAEVDWSPESLALAALQLTRPDGAGEIAGEAMLAAAEGWPFSFSLRLAGVDLWPETGVRTDLHGEVRAEGRLEDYQGRFVLANRGGGWQRGRLASDFFGSLTGITLPELQGEFLAGRLTGKFDAGWREAWQLRAELAGSELQTKAIAADWPGRVNFDLEVGAAGGEDIPVTAAINGKLRDSTLRGRNLTGAVEARLRGEDLHIEELALHGEGFAVTAGGRLRERIDFRAEIPRLAGLVPGAQGSLRAAGWARWRDAHLSGELDASGEALALREMRLHRLTLKARHAKEGAPFTVAADLWGAAWSDYRLATAAVQAEGSAEEHRLRLRATGPDVQLEASARGRYAAAAWQGRLLALKTGGDLFGVWRLAEPVALEVSAVRLKTAPLRLNGPGEEFLAARADLALSPLLGVVAGEWRQLNLARANPWLPDTTLSGRSSGAARFEMLPENRIELKGQLEIAGLVERAGERLPLRRATSQFVWGAKGLQAEIEADLAAMGTLAAAVHSSRPATLEWPEEGDFTAQWRLDDLAGLSPWLPEVALTGNSSGEVAGGWQQERLRINGQAGMAGKVVWKEQTLDIRRLQTDFAWDAEGVRADWTLDLAGGRGGLSANIAAAAPARLEMPERGSLRAEWRGLDLALLRPWLPEDFLLEGQLGGQLNGEWLPGQRLQMSGRAEIAEGELQWEQYEGVIAAALRQARVNWTWQDESFQGDLLLALENYGRAEGRFRLPLAARWPTGIEADGPVWARLQGDLQEEGLLNAILPGVVQESRGRLALDLRLDGTWDQPDFGGEAHLRDAAAYLPTAGIRVEDIQVKAQLAGQQIRIDSFQMRSGPGVVAGEGSVSLDQWRLAGYELRLRGKEFRAIYLPELRMQISPDLQVAGTTQKLTVRGEIHIPSLLVSGRETDAPIRQSPDIVFVDAAAEEEKEEGEKKELPLALDVRVRIVLGEHVLIDTEGVDARLAGALVLNMTGLDPQQMTAQGEIKVAQGKYATYGVSLDITRGNILFAGGPVDRPTLDIQATRTVGEVQAGVKVSGTPRAPKVELYSEPAMPDTDVLSYIVLGRPLGGEGGGDAGLLMLAANTLLSKGESAVLQDRLRRTFGLDVLEIEAGDDEGEGSQITIGKYLNPDLYISFGQSLFANSNEVRMRYNLSENWQLESSVGGEKSAVDLYYKIEFR